MVVQNKKIIVLCALGAGAEYEALKKALADANKKAEAEQELREKHEARVIIAKRELQEAVKKSEGLEQSLKGKESELAQALEDAEGAREEARGAARDIQEARKVAAGKACCIYGHYYVIVGRTLSGKLNSLILQGCLWICLAAYQTPPNSTVPRRGSLRRGASGRSIWR